MKTNYIATALIALIVALATSFLVSQERGDGSAHPSLKEAVLERGVLKCAYVVYAPGVIKDPNTGDVSGIAVDVAHEVAEKLNLEVEWVEEAAWGTMIEGLQTGRYDMVVGMIWPTASRSKRVEFTDPIWYSVAALYARAGDQRFDQPGSVNRPEVKISVIDGEISTLIAQAKYPDAELVTLPQTADLSQMILNVVNEKADVTIVTPYQAGLYMRANPNSLKSVTGDQPLRFSANTLLVPEGEPAFKAMINTTIEELMNTGFIEDVLLKYEPRPGSFYRVASPFRD